MSCFEIYINIFLCNNRKDKYIKISNNILLYNRSLLKIMFSTIIIESCKLQ